jgi:hypothetical protein
MPIDGNPHAANSNRGSLRRPVPDLVVPPLLLAAMHHQRTAAERDQRARDLARSVSHDITAYALQWDRRTVTQPIDAQFWVTVPVVEVAPTLQRGCPGGMRPVNELWAGYPAPDGTRIVSATALVGDADHTRYLMLLFGVHDRTPERRLTGYFLHRRLRETFERVSSDTAEGPVPR